MRPRNTATSILGFECAGRSGLVGQTDRQRARLEVEAGECGLNNYTVTNFRLIIVRQNLQGMEAVSRERVEVQGIIPPALGALHRESSTFPGECGSVQHRGFGRDTIEFVLLLDFVIASYAGAAVPIWALRNGVQTRFLHRAERLSLLFDTLRL
jgi:hypothetical protein